METQKLLNVPLYSAQHPWTLPLRTGEDEDLPVCCFEVVDPDQRTTDVARSQEITGEDGLPDLSAFWEQNDGAFPIKATIAVRDGEVFLPNVRNLVFFCLR